MWVPGAPAGAEDQDDHQQHPDDNNYYYYISLEDHSGGNLGHQVRAMFWSL